MQHATSSSGCQYLMFDPFFVYMWPFKYRRMEIDLDLILISSSSNQIWRISACILPFPQDTFWDLERHLQQKKLWEMQSMLVKVVTDIAYPEQCFWKSSSAISMLLNITKMTIVGGVDGIWLSLNYWIIGFYTGHLVRWEAVICITQRQSSKV